MALRFLWITDSAALSLNTVHTQTHTLSLSLSLSLCVPQIQNLILVTTECGISHKNTKIQNKVFHIQYSSVTPNSLYTADNLLMNHFWISDIPYSLTEWRYICIKDTKSLIITFRVSQRNLTYLLTIYLISGSF